MQEETEDRYPGEGAQADERLQVGPSTSCLLFCGVVARGASGAVLDFLLFKCPI